MDFKELIYKRASQDFYRIGLTSTVVRPNLLFEGAMNMGRPGSPTSIGPSASLESSPKSNLGTTSVKHVNIGLAEVGVREQGGQNRGQRVGEFQKVGGTSAGNPWCAAFVTWCLVQAGVDKSKITSETARVYGWYTWAKRNGRLTNNPQVGDLFGWHNPKTLKGHIGIIVDPAGDKPGYCTTVEGNTGSGGEREGDGVWKRSRKKSTIQWYISLGGIY